MQVNDILRIADKIYDRKYEATNILSIIKNYPAADKAYEEVLNIGGIHVFCRSLRIFGLSEHDEALNIQLWNDKSTWKDGYRVFFTEAWSFAEDVFGNQYLFNKNGVEWLDIETGKLTYLCKTFSDWLQMIEEETDYYTGSSISNCWNQTHPEEAITGEYHLCPIKLFVCGGEYEIDNLFRTEAKEHMEMMASIANQIKDLPDGTPIEFTFDD